MSNGSMLAHAPCLAPTPLLCQILSDHSYALIANGYLAQPAHVKMLGEDILTCYMLKMKIFMRIREQMHKSESWILIEVKSLWCLFKDKWEFYGWITNDIKRNFMKYIQSRTWTHTNRHIIKTSMFKSKHQQQPKIFYKYLVAHKSIPWQNIQKSLALHL